MQVEEINGKLFASKLVIYMTLFIYLGAYFLVVIFLVRKENHASLLSLKGCRSGDGTHQRKFQVDRVIRIPLRHRRAGLESGHLLGECNEMLKHLPKTDALIKEHKLKPEENVYATRYSGVERHRDTGMGALPLPSSMSDIIYTVYGRKLRARPERASRAAYPQLNPKLHATHANK